MKIQSLVQQGAKQSQIMKRLALSPYFANLYMDQAGRFTLKELEFSQTVLLQTDVSIKTGYQKPLLAMTLLIHALIRCPMDQSLNHYPFDD